RQKRKGSVQWRTPATGRDRRSVRPQTRGARIAPSPHSYNARESIHDANGTSVLIVERRLFDEAPHFLFVVFAVQDLPLRTAFGDAALLVFNLLSRGLVDLNFFQKPLVHNFDNGETNRIPVFDEFNFVDRRELVCDLM